MDSLPLVATELLPVLVRHQVRFVLVGATAAVVAGAPILTADLDLVIDTAEDNLARVLNALNELGALYRDPARRRIAPNAERLRTLRLHLLRCSKGDLNLLREIGHGWTYADLVQRSEPVDLGGYRVSVLMLEWVIESKRIANRDKDRAVLPVLEETLRLRRLKDASNKGS